MIEVYATGTQTCSGTTEHYISSPSEIGTYTLVLHLGGMASGHVLEVRAYQTAVSGGACDRAYITSYYGTQSSGNLVVRPIRDWVNGLATTNALRFSIKQTYGSALEVPWTVYREDSLAPATPGRTVIVGTDGSIDADVQFVNDVQIQGTGVLGDRWGPVP